MDERELEAGLRSVLRAREPRKFVTEKILAEARKRERRSAMWRWGAMAAALTLTCALGLTFWTTRRQEDAAASAAGLAAARQLEVALRISSRKVSQLERRLVVHVNSGVDLGRAESN